MPNYPPWKSRTLDAERWFLRVGFREKHKEKRGN
jgi:hypothetical protein